MPITEPVVLLHVSRTWGVLDPKPRARSELEKAGTTSQRKWLSRSPAIARAISASDGERSKTTEQFFFPSQAISKSFVSLLCYFREALPWLRQVRLGRGGILVACSLRGVSAGSR